MQTLFDRTYGTPLRWRRSLSDRMVHLVRRSGTGRYSSNRFDQIQEGFGMLCAEAGVPMLDYTAAYRSPYWTHSQVVEWTLGGMDTVAGGASVAGGGAVASAGGGSGRREPPLLPMHRVLFVPVQALFLRRLKRCCALAFSKCRARGLTCEVADWRADGDCCRVEQLPSLETRQSKLNHSVRPEQARCTSRASHASPTPLSPLCSSSFTTGGDACLMRQVLAAEEAVPLARGLPLLLNITPPERFLARSPIARGKGRGGVAGRLTPLFLDSVHPDAAASPLTAVPAARRRPLASSSQAKSCTPGFAHEDYCKNRCAATSPEAVTALPLLPTASFAEAGAASPSCAAHHSGGGASPAAAAAMAAEGVWASGARADDLRWVPKRCRLERPTAEEFLEHLRGQVPRSRPPSLPPPRPHTRRRPHQSCCRRPRQYRLPRPHTST